MIKMKEYTKEQYIRHLMIIGMEEREAVRVSNNLEKKGVFKR